jgi:hypothetical protein
MNELFPAEAMQSDSPRLRWMNKHGIITLYHAPGHCPPTWFAGRLVWWPELSGVDFFATETAHNGDSRVGEGPTEDDALESLALAAGIPLWNEDDKQISSPSGSSTTTR